LGEETLITKMDEKPKLSYVVRKFDGSNTIDGKKNKISKEERQNFRSQEYKKRQFLESKFVKDLENQLENRPIETVNFFF